MIVMKFGGTSVGTVASLTNVKHIVENAKGSVAVVVSALGGVTDLLIKAARQALEEDTAWHLTADIIETRHRDIVFSHLVAAGKQESLWIEVQNLLSLMRRYYTGIALLTDLSRRTLARVVSLGERMSSLIISHIIDDATLLPSMEMIKTEQWFGRDIADTALCTRLITERFASMSTRVAVCPGFISTDRDTGDITNLGRGGSDYTASLIAASLEAETLDIWTDVDGFMTADPRLIPEASVIPHLSFLESMDLCNFGAKVIYPPTIYPVFHKNIPIRILNTFHPEGAGTLITDAHKATSIHMLRGVTSILGGALLHIRPGAGSDSTELHTRLLDTLSRRGIEVILSTPSRGSEAISIALRREAGEKAMQALREEFSTDSALAPDGIDLQEGVSIVSAVGEGLKSHPQSVGSLLEALSTADIRARAWARGASGYVFTAIVPESAHLSALRLWHSLI